MVPSIPLDRGVLPDRSEWRGALTLNRPGGPGPAAAEPPKTPPRTIGIIFHFCARLALDRRRFGGTPGQGRPNGYPGLTLQTDRIARKSKEPRLSQRLHPGATRQGRGRQRQVHEKASLLPVPATAPPPPPGAETGRRNRADRRHRPSASLTRETHKILGEEEDDTQEMFMKSCRPASLSPGFGGAGL